MWTTKEREQICVNTIKGRKSFSKVFCHLYGKLEENEYEKKVLDESLLVSMCVLYEILPPCAH